MNTEAKKGITTQSLLINVTCILAVQPEMKKIENSIKFYIPTNNYNYCNVLPHPFRAKIFNKNN